jgi:transposase-like protein
MPRFNPRQTILAGVSQATLQQWLTQAQQAYADLVSGAKVVSVGYDGKTATYTQAQRADLEAWIELLQRQLGRGGRRRALRPYFR